MKKKQKKVDGKAVALAAFTLWLKKAPKIEYAMAFSKTAFVIHGNPTHQS